MINRGLSNILTTAMRLFLGGNLDSQALDSNPDEGQAGGVARDFRY